MDGTDSDYDGGSSGSTVDRSGCQWFKLQIVAGVALTLADHTRIYDSASSDPYYYYMPSLMVNSANDMIMGFSGSRTTEYIGAFYTGRRSSGVTPGRPILIQAGRGYFGLPQWGDYSYTSLDPDAFTFWTIQEYSELPGTHPAPWGTWIGKLKTNP